MKRAKWYKKSSDDGEETGDDPELKALDIGAGEIRREWEGYKTYTTDIRSDVGADYVMDTRLLNLPDDSFDLLASNHHLEHIGRYEQDKVWTEMFRVLKPGGRMEHKVPNLMWAAHKLMDGSHESTVWDVFYGGQEDMGYERQYNTHYFGYTPTLLEAAAVKCGLVDVEVKSYKDDPDLMYDMVVTGRKPDAEEKNETTEETPPEEPDGDNLPETS
jgi:SAM-dependent methyltransferase